MRVNVQKIVEMIPQIFAEFRKFKYMPYVGGMRSYQDIGQDSITVIVYDKQEPDNTRTIAKRFSTTFLEHTESPEFGRMLSELLEKADLEFSMYNNDRYKPKQYVDYKKRRIKLHV